MLAVVILMLVLFDTCITAALLMRYKSANEAFKTMTETYSHMLKVVCASDALKSGKQVSLSDVVALVNASGSDDE